MPDISERPELAGLASTESGGPWLTRLVVVGCLLTASLIIYGLTMGAASDEAPFDDSALRARLATPTPELANELGLLTAVMQGPDWGDLDEQQQRYMEAVRDGKDTMLRTEDLPFDEPVLRSLLAALARDIALADKALGARLIDYGNFNNRATQMAGFQGMQRLFILQRLRRRAAAAAGRPDEAFGHALAMARVLSAAQRSPGSIHQYANAVVYKRQLFEDLLELLAKHRVSSDVLRAALEAFPADGHSQRALTALHKQYQADCTLLQQLPEDPDEWGLDLTISSYTFHPNTTRRLLAEAYDRAASNLRTRRRVGMRDQTGWYEPSGVMPNAIGAFFLQMTDPNSAPLLDGVLHDEATDVTMRAVILLMLHEREQGALPPTLEALGGAAAALRDPFGSDPPRWDPERRLLWFVGADGSDGGAVNSGSSVDNRWELADPCVRIPRAKRAED